MIALVIPIFNRPAYLEECFDSLQRLTTKPDIVVLVDDHSTDMNVVRICKSYKGAIYIRHQKNKGVRGALQTGIECAIKEGAKTIINLDSDAIVTPDFISILMNLRSQWPDKIVSGFNNISRVNPIVKEWDAFYLKNYLNGINMCFTAQQYKDYVLPALKMEGNWDYNLSIACRPFVVSKPSCVQHIGMESSMGHSGNGIEPDTAQDFKALDLPDVTLFGIDAHDVEGIKRAAEISQRHINFGDVQIITQRQFPGKTLNEGRSNYSKFIIKQLTNHFKTSHVLIIHADGYVQNWKAWDNDWLQYDYIGARWLYHDGMANGNGGFSLRSKKLQDILAKMDLKEWHPEDEIICRRLRTMLEKEHRIKFAPYEVCDKFSIEAYGCGVMVDGRGIAGNQYTGQFGFHSYNVTGLPIPPKR